MPIVETSQHGTYYLCVHCDRPFDMMSICIIHEETCDARNGLAIDLVE